MRDEKKLVDIPNLSLTKGELVLLGFLTGIVCTGGMWVISELVKLAAV